MYHAIPWKYLIILIWWCWLSWSTQFFQ